MDNEIDVKFGEVWIDIPEELIQRMMDIVTAVSQGHESMFLLAEATRICAQLDFLMSSEV